ncbi:type 4 pilus major pilin [Escherichia coli]|uniref:type 4 pilus major pilin n=1 Tax=Enterobacteriaceae TaxID=543 RepID=UPI000E2DDCEF|nr:MULTISPECIES: type 4 pilus major pilin [Enterobacteriaceae]MBL2562417.1 bundlin family protein [Klebsiella pneumoniae]SYV42558.1 Bundle-forming pilin [Klebsiella pneumoniae]HCD7228235.1 prepilin-type N-terminal cleavage/methylation domain-containing protein [Enterobacter hormaechei]
MFNMTKRKKKGFSLLELLLVFGIIAALIVGVFMIYPKISSGQKIDSDIKILGTLNAGIKNLYAGQADYTGLSVDAVIKSKIVPEDIVDDNLIWDSWGANVLIEPYYDGSFYIGFENVSVDSCPKFVSQAGASFFKIVVGSREVKNTEANQDLDMATLANACISNDDGYGGRPITVYFYDK